MMIINVFNLSCVLKYQILPQSSPKDCVSSKVFSGFSYNLRQCHRVGSSICPQLASVSLRGLCNIFIQAEHCPQGQPLTDAYTKPSALNSTGTHPWAHPQAQVLVRDTTSCSSSDNSFATSWPLAD